MGLYVHSLAEIPSGARRSFYVYLLDYGWENSLGDAVRANIPRMADIASRSSSVVIHGPRGVHFEDEVLSWHHINGEDADNILPAILVTTRHPRTFRESFGATILKADDEDALLLVPLKKICKTADEVVELVDKIFRDIQDRKVLAQFKLAKETRRGVGRALVDAVILKPSVSGIGFDVKQFFSRKQRYLLLTTSLTDRLPLLLCHS